MKIVQSQAKTLRVNFNLFSSFLEKKENNYISYLRFKQALKHLKKLEYLIHWQQN